MNYVFLADGFEEIEALAVVDILRRADLEVATVSIMSGYEVTGAHDILVTADVMFSDIEPEVDDCIILPGGLPGATSLRICKPLCCMIESHFANGGHVAAICAAPFILGELGILNGAEAICYPGFEDKLEGATISEKPVVKSGRIITGKGPGVAMDFALAIVEDQAGAEIAAELRKGMMMSNAPSF